ncbi:ATP-binding protein [Mongoliitalea daihaiensis]|uniref:ATP-binding protein n=1 Tax=Mongoliitalea daihaiensis TaxID=2782006 RepID=UPI001F2266B4|nr:ATP-binding protein [Mongoliitalea daihaiensis]UJP64998.1 PAS domain S-box protein [Mongoliitalea daihaiensis]
MRFIFLLVCTLFWSFQIQSQSFTFNQQIRGVDLPSETINGLLQDSKGRMWFNTAMGVFYSDGFSSYPIPSEIQTQLSNDVGMFLDKDGWIWIFNRTKSTKIFFYDQRNWNELELPEGVVDQVASLYKRMVVFGSKEKKKVVLMDDQKLYLLDRLGSKWGSFELSFEEVGFFASHWEDSDDQWLLFDKSVISIQNNQPQFISLDNPFGEEGVFHIAKEKDTYFFLGRNFLASGSSSTRLEKILVEGFEEPKYTHVDFSFMQIHKGKVYYFFNSSLMQYDPSLDRVLKVETMQSLRSYSLTDALVDREDIIWLASTRGLVNVFSLMFVNYNKKEFLDDEITAIHVLDENRYLLGFNNGLQVWENNQVQTLQYFPELISQPKNRITNIVADKVGQVWISSNQQGVGKYYPKTRKFQFFNTLEKEEVIGVFPIKDSVYISAKNRLYVASVWDEGERLFSRDISDDWRKYSGLKEFYIRKIGPLDDGRLMVLLGGNVYTNDSISSTSSKLFVVGFDYMELDSAILIGTEKGLKIYNEKGLNDFNLYGQRILRPVYALKKDLKGRVWAGTDKGMFVIDESTIKNYSERSGLVGSEINRGALARTPSGQMLIGTHKGLSIFYPTEENLEVPKPFLEITSLAMLNSDEEDLDLRKISSSNNFIEVAYMAPSFLQSLDYVVHYYLEGFHEDWIQVTNPRTNAITFSNLPPGTYRFHMKISLGNITETGIVSSQEFVVLKPVYLRLWFILMVLVVFFFIGYLVSTLLTQFKEKGVLKKAIDEKILEASVTEDQFKNVWMSSKDGLSLTTEEGKIIAANPALEKMVGISEKVLEEAYLWDIFSDSSYYEKQRKYIEELIIRQNSTTFSLEMNMPFFTGMKVIDYFSTELKSDFNGKKVFLSVFTDITKQRQQELRLQAAKEKAEEDSRLKTSFLSNMSHEIRTPLNGILGTAEHIMLERAEEKDLVDQLEIILESGERLLHTINSILDLSKIEANKMDLTYKETNINDFVAKILLPLKALAMKKGLLLTAKYEQQPLVGKIDQRYVEMIINNLVGNAIKYSEQGLVSVKVSKQAGNLLIKVEDQGIGMSEEFKSRLFQPFEQESDGYIRQFEGSGLGLAITHSLIALMGGSIDLQSKKGVGTMVLVFLPLDKN